MLLTYIHFLTNTSMVEINATINDNFIMDQNSSHSTGILFQVTNLKEDTSCSTKIFSITILTIQCAQYCNEALTKLEH